MKETLKAIYKSYKSGIWGAAIGLVFGLLVLIIGFFRTVFLFLCVVLGFLLGRMLTDEDSSRFDRLLKIFRRK